MLRGWIVHYHPSQVVLTSLRVMRNSYVYILVMVYKYEYKETRTALYLPI